MALHAGQTIRERYEIETLLGEGGMGAVYRAVDLAFSAHVALKENRFITPESQRQFQREASLLYRMRHPNLPRVIDYFAIPGQGQYLVMDYVEGEDLKQLLARRGPVPQAEALSWIGQVLDALAYLHSHQIIHRDVKPANVKISPEGQVFLVDFGLAKIQDPSEETTIGARGVTPGYAPPEQYGAGRTDERTDVYSVGATLYALLSGGPPPDALHLVVGGATLTPLRQVRPDVSAHVERAVQRAMQTRPDDRYQRIAHFREALELPLAGVPASTPPPRPVVPDVRETRLRGAGPSAAARQEPPAPQPTPYAGARPAQKQPPPPPTVVAPPAQKQPPPAPTPPPAPSPATGTASSAGQNIWQRLTARPAGALLAAIGVVLAGLVVALIALGAQRSAPPVSGIASTDSGDGILFTRELDGPPEVYRLHGGQVEQVTNTPGNAGSCCAAQTGAGVFFSSDRDGKPELYRLHEGRTDRMTHTPGNRASWGVSAGDTGILFTSDRDGKPEVYRLHDGVVERITNTPGRAGSWDPVWTDQGIFFTSDRDGKREIYRLHEGRTDRMTHTPGDASSWGAAADERGILFTSNRDGKPEVYRLHDGVLDRVTNTPGRGGSWGAVWTAGGIFFTSDRDGKPEVYRLHEGHIERMTNTPGSGASWLELPE